MKKTPAGSGSRLLFGSRGAASRRSLAGRSPTGWTDANLGPFVMNQGRVALTCDGVLTQGGWWR